MIFISLSGKLKVSHIKTMGILVINAIEFKGLYSGCPWLFSFSICSCLFSFVKFVLFEEQNCTVHANRMVLPCSFHFLWLYCARCFVLRVSSHASISLLFVQSCLKLLLFYCNFSNLPIMLYIPVMVKLLYPLMT